MKRFIGILLICLMLIMYNVSMVQAENIDSILINTFKGTIVISGNFTLAGDSKLVSIFFLKEGKTQNDLINAININDVVSFVDITNLDENGNYTYEFTPQDITENSLVVVAYGNTVETKLLSDFNTDFNVEIHVSPNGNDENEGTLTSPLATLEGARSVASILVARGFNVTVLLHAGEYFFGNGVDFTNADSGVKYCAAGDGEVVFSGSKKLDISEFEAVSDVQILNRLPYNSRNKVYQMDLSDQGITSDMIDMTSNLTVGTSANILGVYFNGKKQSLARWPNIDYNTFENVLQMGGRKRWSENEGLGAEFEYTGDNPSRWVNATDAYITGYFGNDYANEWAKIGLIDPINKTITLANWTSYGVVTGKRWAAINLLEEIDMPGEWFVDKSTMMLYYYPTYPLNTSNDTLEIATLYEPFISATNTNNVTFDGIHFKCAKKDGINLFNTDGINITNCTIENVGGIGITIFGENTLVQACQIYNTGSYCIKVTGGSDAQTFTSGGNRIENNHFYQFNLNGSYSGNYAISLGKNATGSVIGDVVENNIIHGGWDANGIQYGGNDNIIRYNEIYNVSRNVADSGAINSGRRFNEYGNEIRYNYIHDFGSLFSSSYPNCGIYWDDWQSGQLAENNIIVANNMNNSTANILVGRDNTFRYNIIANTKIGASATDRTKWNCYLYNNEAMQEANATLSASKVTNVMLSKYPAMLTFADDFQNFGGRFIVRGNVITDNLNVNSGAVSIDSFFNTYSTVSNNSNYSDNSIFVDAANQDYRITNMAMTSYGFSENMINESNFSMDEIGIQEGVFDIQNASGSFRKLYPCNGQKSIEPQEAFIQWENALFADQYDYVVATDAQLTNVVESGTAYQTYVQLDGLANNTTYYWKVTAKNLSKQIGNTWENSDGVFSFTTANDFITVNSFKLFDEIGGYVTSFEGKNGNFLIGYNLTNKTQGKIDLTLITTLRDNVGILRAVNTVNDSIDAGASNDKEVSVNYNIQCQEGWYIECYIWDDLQRIKPLINRKLLLQ